MRNVDDLAGEGTLLKWLRWWMRWWLHIKWMWCHHVRNHPKQELIHETSVVGCPTCCAMWRLETR